jgi:DNA-binding NtrC family response regulator
VHVLMVEDDPVAQKLLRAVILRADVTARVHVAENVEQAAAVLGTRRPDVITLDLGLPPRVDAMLGLRLIPLIDAMDLLDRTVVVSGVPDVLRRAQQAGATHVVEKPFDSHHLLGLLQEIGRGEPTFQWHVPTMPPELRAIIGVSRAIVRLRDEIDEIARSSSRVLVLGETGTGKELVAAALHACSGRPGELFAANCASWRTLAAAQILGYERGAFTGAERTTPGVFERAGKGTVLLDEVAELPVEEVQPQLLRVLSDAPYERLGAARPKQVLLLQARVVAATHEDLWRLVEEKRFRQDLFYRLSGFVLRIPPLRDRPEDLEPLVVAYARGTFELTRDGLEWLQGQPWPGNVRELYHLLGAVADRRRGRRVDADALREEKSRQRLAPLAKARAVAQPRADEPNLAAGAEGVTPLARVRTVERELLAGAIHGAGGNVSEAARRYGLDRMPFIRLARRHGLLD